MKGQKNANSNKGANNQGIARAKASHVVLFESPNGEVEARAFTYRAAAVKRQMEIAKENMFAYLLTAKWFVRLIGDFNVAPDGAVIF